MIRACPWIVAILLSAAPAAAQHEPSSEHHSAYAQQEATDVAGLSRPEMDDLLAGSGMGFARPAELNQYPGPKHVLELAAELELDDAQHAAISRVRAAMLARARELGQRIVELERHLDRRFAHRHIDESSLRSATAEIAELYGELRFVHLRAHLETRDLLSPAQIERYDQLRGYSR